MIKNIFINPTEKRIRTGSRILIFLLVLFLPQISKSNLDNMHILSNSKLQIEIDIKSGSIANVYSFEEHRQMISVDSEQEQEIFGLHAGDFVPANFIILESSSSELLVKSSYLANQHDKLKVETLIRFTLNNNGLRIKYKFNTLKKVELINGLDIRINQTKWESIAVYNHFAIEPQNKFNTRNGICNQALNQIYGFTSGGTKMVILFPNPYHSLINIIDDRVINWRVLAATEPLKAKEPKGPNLASVLTPGVIVNREVEMFFLSKKDDILQKTGPLAYFSPWPNGYEQIIAMTFDDIPFEPHWVYPASGHDPNSKSGQYLVRLLEDHPKMKMGWLILLDGIMEERNLDGEGYPPGKWWLAHNKYRLATKAPNDFIEWMQNIEKDNLVYGYENRVHLGNHGYHHTPEMEWNSERNWEFQYYDPIVHDSTLATIVKEYELLGLSEKSHKWIRFPGFCFTRSTIDALIKYNFILFDYYQLTKKSTGLEMELPWMLFYSEFGRIWGIGTYWGGDKPDPFKRMDHYLSAGKLCHTAGHPYAWFNNGTDEAYLIRSQIFNQAELKYPNLAYMFPDEVGFFADETYDIENITRSVSSGDIIIKFSGKITKLQTIVIEVPYNYRSLQNVHVNGKNVVDSFVRRNKIFVILPELDKGEHVLVVEGVIDNMEDAADNQQKIFSLKQNFPNPFSDVTSIEFMTHKSFNDSEVQINIYNIIGQKVKSWPRQVPLAGISKVKWDGKDKNGESVVPGIYIYSLTSKSKTISKKMLYMKK